MSWQKVVLPISLGTLLAIVGSSIAAGKVLKTHEELPARVAAVELKQQKTDERQQNVEQGLSRVEGKVDTVISLLRGHK